MIALIALVLGVLTSLVMPNQEASAVVIIPAKPQHAPVVVDQDAYEWTEYYSEAYNEYADEFTALFNSYETKVAKNGAMMIRKGSKGSYTFAKKG